jgi:hypothetical protein
MDPNNLTLKDVTLTLSPTLGLISGLVFLAKGFTVVGTIVLAPTIAIFVYSFYKLPYKEIGVKLAQREEKLKESAFGRVRLGVEKVFDYIGILYFLFIVCAAAWWFFSN